MNRDTRETHESTGIKSVDTALTILEAMGKSTRPLSLSELSAACNEAPSKVHRYLATFVKHHFAVQTHRHGSYSLGRNCIQMGLVAMRQIDLFGNVEGRMPELARASGFHVFLAIWTAAGPVVVRWAYSENPMTVNTMPGQVVAITRSATGRLFSAFLAPFQTEGLIKRELAEYGEDSAYARDLRSSVLRAKEERYAISRGEIEPHIQSVAVPIMDWRDNSLIVVGCSLPMSASDTEVQAVIALLKQFSMENSINPTMSYFAAPSEGEAA